MKEMRGNLLSERTIMAVLGNVLFFIFYLVNLNLSWKFLIGLFIINLVLWIVSYQGYHYFQLDGKELKVKNSLMPFVNDVYLLTDIKKLYVDNVSQLGRSLIIEFKSGRKKAYGASDCSRSDLDEFANFINSQINPS